MRWHVDRGKLPPRELLDFKTWYTERGIPVAEELGRAGDTAGSIVALNARWEEYPRRIAARVDWAAAHGGSWPVGDSAWGDVDEPDYPRPYQMPTASYCEGVLPHPGRWSADGGVITCWEHNLAREAH